MEDASQSLEPHTIDGPAGAVSPVVSNPSALPRSLGMSPKLRAPKRKATEDDGPATLSPPDASLSLSLSSSGRHSQLSQQMQQGDGSQGDFAASFFQDSSLSSSQDAAAAAAAPSTTASSRTTRKSKTAAATAASSSSADAMEDEPPAASSSSATAKKRRTAAIKDEEKHAPAAASAAVPAASSDSGFAAPWVSQLGCGYNGVIARSTSHRLLIPSAYRASALLSAPANKLPAGWVAASWPNVFHFKLSIHGASALRSHTSNSSTLALHLNVPADILSLRAERGGAGSRESKAEAEADSKVSATLYQVARVYFDPSSSQPLSSLVSPSLRRALRDVLDLSSDALDRSQAVAVRRAWDEFFEQHGTEVVVGVRLGHSVYEESEDASAARSVHTERNATASNNAGVQLPPGIPVAGGAGVGGQHSKANGSSSERSSARNRSSSLSHSYGSEAHWCDLASDTLELTDPALWPDLPHEARRRFEEARTSFLERGRAEMADQREQERTQAEVLAAADAQSSVAIDDGMSSQELGLPSPASAAAAAASSSSAAAALASDELLYGFRFVSFPLPSSSTGSHSNGGSSLLSKARSARSPPASSLFPFQCSPDLAESELRILSGGGSSSGLSSGSKVSSEVLSVLSRFINEVNRARAKDRNYITAATAATGVIDAAATNGSSGAAAAAAETNFSSSSLQYDNAWGKGAALTFEQRCALLLAEWQSKLRSHRLFSAGSSSAHWSLIVHFGRSNPWHVHTHKSFVRFECRAHSRKEPNTTKIVSVMFMQHKQ